MLLQECLCRPKCVVTDIHARLSCMHQQEAYRQVQSSSPPSRKNETSFPGQHEELARGLTSGLERSKGGSHLASLVNIPWKPKHTLLASCHAVVEAAALGLGSPQATLSCAPSDVDWQQFRYRQRSESGLAEGPDQF